MNKISVIIPIYKVEKYLNKCIESVVGQTYKNLEIILVDDGSPDGCPAICDAWGEKDARIKVVHKANGGLSDARNVGVENSTGDYLMFLDSDDYVDTKICEKLYSLLTQEENIGFSMCEFAKFLDGETPNVATEGITQKVFDRQGIIDQIFDCNIELLMIACAKLYKREIFEKIKFPVGKLHEDEFVTHEVLFNCEKFAYTNEQLYFYLTRPTSITCSKGIRNIEHLLEAFENRYNYLNENLPECGNRNKLLYLKNLRALYAYNLWLPKEYKKDILKRFKDIYKQTQNCGLKNKAFKFLPNLTSKIHMLLKSK